jgi:arylsulfatase A
MKKITFTRREFLRTSTLGMVIYAIQGHQEITEMYFNKKLTRPNLVFILVDDLGWVDTGCYSSRFHKTPNIDSLADEGIRFTNAYAASAACSTTASIMTGHYPVNYRNMLWMELDEITIAQALKPTGYVSCHIGKRHTCSDDWYADKQGFDFSVVGFDFCQLSSYSDPYFRKKQGHIPTLESRHKEKNLTDRQTDKAVKFIHMRRNKPFFLYLTLNAVHPLVRAKTEITTKKTPSRHYDSAYAAMIEEADNAMGKICTTLDELGLAQNTIIFFTSDNGGPIEVTSNAPLRAGKGYPYEGGIRVPLIIRWPNVIQAGSVSEDIVTSVDYFPTICEAAGVPLPGDREIDGISLLEHLKSNGAIPLNREAIFWHFPHYRGDIVPYSIIRAGHWKLIKRYEGKTYELFNLRTDLSEKNDLSEKLPKKVKELDAKLSEWLKTTGAKLPDPNSRYKPG